MSRLSIRLVCLLAVACLSAIAVAEGPRARPPEFTDEDRAAFFDDAFGTLVGERPEPAAPGAIAATESRAEPSSDVRWRDLVAPDVLETEIKRQATRLAGATRSASAYKAGGFQEAADALAIAAACFAVTTEHGGQPRWHDAAAGLRDLFATGAQEADAATDAAYRVAQARAADLQDLVRGGRPDAPKPQATIDWAEVASRSAVMRRMGEAEEERLRGWVASERDLARNAEDARHEAQVLAALAEALLRPEAYDHDDPDYAAHARRLRDAASRLARAAEAEEHPAAAEALSEVSRSCVDCHADYRG